MAGEATNTGGGMAAGAAGAEASASMSDEQFLSVPDASGDAAAAERVATDPDLGGEPEGKTASEKEAPDQQEINFDALEESAPEWLAKVSDKGALAEVQKLLDLKKAFDARFKDSADLESFFADLPGGREQITALQTLAKETSELDSALEGNDFAGHVSVAERVLSQAPQNAASITRAWAQTLAKTNPQAWNQVSSELVNSTLKAAGLPVALNDLLGAVKDMKSAIAANDGDAFGRAASKLLGELPRETQEDPRITEANRSAETARAERDRTLGTQWTGSQTNAVQSIRSGLEQQINGIFSKVLPKSIADGTRNDLRGKILNEINSQMASNTWVGSQIADLVGTPQQPKLNATAADWNKAIELSKNAANGLVTSAVRKVVKAWTNEQLLANREALNRAKKGATRTDVGSGNVRAKTNGKGPINRETLAKMSDEEFLAL